VTKLIVTGDDFGLSPAVNEAIVLAHARGLLTSASLMVNAPATEEALALARAHPTLAVGLHLVLCQGRSTLSPDRLPGLVDRRGNFPQSALLAGIRYFFARRLRPQLRLEIEAQLQAFAATGLPLAHLDGHLNLHLHPVVLSILLELAPRYRIRAMRLTRDDLRAALALDRRRLGYKLSHALVFSALCRYARPRIGALGIRTADRVYGLLQSGDMNEAYLLGLLPRMRGELVEWYCHPASAPVREDQARSSPYRPRDELDALTSPRLIQAVAMQGLGLTTYSEPGSLPASPSSASRPPRSIR